MAGVSTLRPVPSEAMSRSSWAWAQVSGDAEPAALPLVKPIEAVDGSLPYGEAARSGSSQACSGTSPTPEGKLIIAWARDRAPEPDPAARQDPGPSAASVAPRCPGPPSFA